MAETIPLNRIVTEGTQTRVVLNETVIHEYAEAYEEGIELPPIEVYFDRETYWLADGFHRARAAQQIGRDTIAANVHPGGQRDAILHAVGANETHGLRRTNADRRRAVLLMLDDPEWSQWSDRDLAARCAVSHTFVNRLRHETSRTKGQPATEEKRKYQRGGKTQTMRTKNIGAAKRGLQTAPPQAREAEQTAEVPTVNGLQRDADKHPSETPPAPSDREPTRPEGRAPITEHEPVPLPDAPPESLPTAAPRPDQPQPEASPTDHAAFELQATTVPEELIAQVSLSLRWEYATSSERQDFVAHHHDELRKMLAKIERQKHASS